MLKYFQSAKLTTKKTGSPNILSLTQTESFQLKVLQPFFDFNCLTYFLTNDFHFAKGHFQSESSHEFRCLKIQLS